MKHFRLVLSILICCYVSFGQRKESLHSYLDSAYPKDSVALFASGVISTHLNEYNITFSPDGNVLLYTIANNTYDNRFYTIFTTEKKKGKWTKRKIASFSGQFSDADPFFAPSGKGVYFISNRPTTSFGSAKTDFDIWYADYQNGHFGLPRHLGSVVNSLNDELYPSVSAKGNLFFSTENGSNGYDLMVSKYENGQFQKPVGVSDSINTAKIEFDAFVSPDESYIIYTGMGSTDNFGSGDLYVSINNGDCWSAGKNLGNAINSIHMDQCPMVSPDGRFLFFTSFRDSQPYDSTKPMTAEEYISILNSPLNGLGNIFWVELGNVIRK